MRSMPPDGDDERIPVNILTGFLGSGKTTVLRHVLRHPGFADTAVLINEFGEVGLDHMLVGRLEQEPVLLQSGCICCSIRGDLSRAIRDLQAGRHAGSIPPFRRVIVETTGLADPTPILATITADRVIRHHFRAGAMVATIDALHAGEGLTTHPELARQAAIADRLIVTKTDMAQPAQVARLYGRLKQLNPSAMIVSAVQGVVDPEQLVGQDTGGSEARLAEAGRWAAEAIPADLGPATRHGSIHSFCLTREAPLPWSAFGLWLSLLVHRHGAKLLRVKGLLNVAGSDTPVAIHAVQHVIHQPEHLPAWPAEDRRSRLVFIVTGLEGWQVERSFNSFIALAERMGAEPPPSLVRSAGDAVHEREHQA
jgi:G3E family GTPase